jgi:hypothetical protein
MQQYKIGEESYKKFRRRWVNIGIPVISAIVAFGIAIVVYSQRDDGFNPMPYVIPVMAVLFTFSIVRGLKRQRRLLMSYSVTLSNSEITREQLNTPPLTINFMEIKEILKTKKGGFMIKGRSKTDVIHIPYLIDNAGDLEEALAKFAPITMHVRESQQRWLKLAPAVLGLGGFVTLLITKNNFVAVVAGVVVIAMFTLRFIELVTNKNVPTNLKRRGWTYLLIIVLVIFMLYTKLTAPGY